MQIYWIKAQAPRRVLALAKHLGLDVEYIEMDLMAGEMTRPPYAALNPNMKAPTLVDGDVVLPESSAIMAYLCIKAGSDMWPARNPAEQVDVLRWLSWNDQQWAPAVAPYYFEHIVKPTFNIGPIDRAALEGKADMFHRWATVFDAHLAGRSHVACGRLTIADFQLASMATYWKQSEMPLGGYRNIVSWIDRLLQIPAWADPWPEVSRAAE
ncbi:MAG: glutathione S-transferase family protein [Parvibaculum sp.]|uniref:glutathione S-transferase family protein n=1 Tax=Parvibaculum sp. TaxID=2024848 RepID=UPI00283B1F0D|nr:glutathione S-transferase family protein [Parvibaculum sp.]MDR3499480.1 glutathione S-transferase family protein [Parvibaculum sp.]